MCFRKKRTWVAFIVTYICILYSVYDQSSITHFHTLVVNLPVGPAGLMTFKVLLFLCVFEEGVVKD